MRGATQSNSMQPLLPQHPHDQLVGSLWERINIGAFLLWVGVLALLHRSPPVAATRS
jgi:hypothetical protein